MLAKKEEFLKEKVAVCEKFTTDLDFKVGLEGNDFIQNLLTARMSANIASKLIDERDLTHYTEPPTFLDWLLQRRKKVVFKFQAKDLLLNPPKGNVERIYIIEEKSINQ